MWFVRLATISCYAASVLLTSNAAAAANEEDRETIIRELLLVMASGEESSEPDLLGEIEKQWRDNRVKTLGLWRLMRVLFSSTLGRLGYGTGPFTWRYGETEDKAIRRFQSDLGITASGQLDSLTVHHLLRARQALDKARIILPQKTFSALDTYISVQGTWRAVDFEAALPINAVTIVCLKERSSCETWTVDFISEDLKQVHVSREYYDVISWGADRVVAQSQAPCRQHLLTVNSTTEDVVLLSQDKEGCGKDELMTMTSHVVNAFCDDGFKDIELAVYGEKEFYERLLQSNMDYK